MQQDQKRYGALYAFLRSNWRVILRVAWRILEFVGFVIAIFALRVGISALQETVKSNELAREAIDDSHIAQSWQIITARAPGSSGKKQALERLYASGESLQGVDLLGAKMSGANLSGVVFCDDLFGYAENLSQEQIERAWACADRPPVFKAGKYALELDMPSLCDPGLREAYEAKQKVGKPWGC